MLPKIFVPVLYPKNVEYDAFSAALPAFSPKKFELHAFGALWPA